MFQKYGLCVAAMIAAGIAFTTTSPAIAQGKTYPACRDVAGKRDDNCTQGRVAAAPRVAMMAGIRICVDSKSSRDQGPCRQVERKRT